MYKNACCGFYRSERLYTYRRQDFQNIYEIDYAVALDIIIPCSLNMELNVMLIVHMEFAYIRHS